TYKKLAVQWLNEVQFFNQTFVLVDSFVLRNRQLLIAATRCGNTKSIQPGDRIFLLKVGTEPKGIIAAGFSTSTPFYEKHWSGENKDTLYIDVDFEVLLNPDQEPILTVDILKTGNLAQQNWRPMASGISVRPELVDELEAVWFDFLTTQKIRHNPFIPTDNNSQKTYTE
ncbi:MAG: hypothetical protein KF843_11790, partial [Flavobacteriales bacterium]|nr:hypothetical protein [Flavobacteriales bacterium]